MSKYYCFQCPHFSDTVSFYVTQIGLEYAIFYQALLSEGPQVCTTYLTYNYFLMLLLFYSYQQCRYSS